MIFSDIKLDCASILDRIIFLRVLLKLSLVLNIEIGVGLMFFLFKVKLINIQKTF